MVLRALTILMMTRILTWHLHPLHGLHRLGHAAGAEVFPLHHVTEVKNVG
jgi:hypothetical protein